ncbi:MAG: NDP-sugar synthase [Elusimicrobia bacterium]|nr:NDP-sugar synthase [Elusimicrobiota bacterium]
MRALILIGGQGTRLRPFTLETPKPLLPVVNRPFLHYQLEILRRHGVKEAVLCTAYRPDAFKKALGSSSDGVRLQYVQEKIPLGTGGAVRNAEKFIDDTVLILNGDILNTFDITEFLKSHRKAKADVSIALTRVKDPTLYGLVETAQDGRIRRFLEKPSWDEINCNTVNAGAYLFEPTVIQFIPPAVSYSLERGLFPQLLLDDYRLNGFVTGGYWMDIGTVDKYLQVHLDILGGATPFRAGKKSDSKRVHAGAGVSIGRDVSHEGAGEVILGAKTKIGPYARFVGSVCVGADCRVGQGAVLEDCVVLSGTHIGDGAQLRRCVVGHECRIGASSTLGAGRALGDRSVVQRFSQL